MTLRLLALLGLLVLGQVVLAGPAAAHTSLIATSPVADAQVEPGLDELVLTFSQPVSEVLSEVVVTAPGEIPWTTGGPEVQGSTLTQQVRPVTTAGEYLVAWRVVSGDGHPITGTFTFEVPDAPTQPAAAPGNTPAQSAAPTSVAPTGAASTDAAPTDAAPAAASSQTTAAGPWLPVVSVLVVAAIALGLVTRVLSRRRSATTTTEDE